MNEILDTKTNLALPDALENFHELSSKLDGRSPMLFLDYDGTLTPIVSNPEDAVLSADTKAIIQDLTQAIPVAIISGRDRKNIESIFDHPDLFYAGSHGYDITGPNGLQKQHEQGPELLPSLDEAERNLKVSLARIPGVLVERKKYAIAVHYRNVEKAHVQQVKTTVAEEVGKHPKLKKGKGKKIIELKPELDWHKGKALLWLMEELKSETEYRFPIFIGDDITDEDAFKAIKDSGIGILVGTHEDETAASFGLEKVEDVNRFLRQLKNYLNSKKTN